MKSPAWCLLDLPSRKVSIKMHRIGRSGKGIAFPFYLLICSWLFRYCLSEFAFKKATMDIDTTSTSEKNMEKRVEWTHLRYHSIFDPSQAYEVDLDWMVATSHYIAEIVKEWNRKAVACSLHIVPIPHDPFALPLAGKSDPLRGPIYMSLNMECLPKVLSGKWRDLLVSISKQHHFSISTIFLFLHH